MSKLITREAQNDQLILEFLDQLVHLGIVPDGRASERCHIHNQNHLPLVFRKTDIFSSQGRRLEVKKVLNFNRTPNADNGRHASSAACSPWIEGCLPSH